MPLPVSVSDSPLSTHVPFSPAFQASLVPQPILEEKEPEDLAFDAPNHGDFSNLDLDFLDNYDVSPKKGELRVRRTDPKLPRHL